MIQQNQPAEMTLSAAVTALLRGLVIAELAPTPALRVNGLEQQEHS